MRDLDALAPDSTVRLVSANDIDDRGRVAGQAVEPATGDLVAFSAEPSP